MAQSGSFGKVFLVGAGPGDAGLITLRGIQRLQSADVVLYDGLVNEAILRHAQAHATLICVGKHGHGGMWTQREIDDQTVEYAKNGKTVVRLKGGDTAIFARTSEEVDRLKEEQIEYEIVPGITAAMAATAYAGIPLTHRDWSSAVAFVTGQQQPADGSLDAEDSLDWKALATFPGTLVFYMGVTSAKVWSHKLIEGGMAPSTPVAMIRRVSCPDQQVHTCTLGTVVATLDNLAGLRPPVITIVGEVVGAAATMDWFQRRPLVNQQYLVIGPQSTNQKLCDHLEDLGARVLHQPAMEMLPPADWTDVDHAIQGLSQFDWVVFSSSHAVDFWMTRLFELGFDSRRIGDCKIASVGHSTTEALRRWHLRADATPSVSGIQNLSALLTQECVKRQTSAGATRATRFLFVRTASGKTEGLEAIANAGGDVTSVHVYTQKPSAKWPATTLDLLRQRKIRGVLATSLNVAIHAMDQMGVELASHQRWFCLSDEIAKGLTDRECRDVVVASHLDFSSLVSSIVQHEIG